MTEAKSPPSSKPQESFIRRHIVPKNIEDPALRLALEACARSFIGTSIVLSTVAGVVIFFMGMNDLFFYTAWVIPAIVVALIAMKMGYHRQSRMIYLITTNFAIIIGSQILGYKSFLWSILISSMPAGFFAFTDREQDLRKRFYFSILASTLLTFLLHAYNVYPNPWSQSYPVTFKYIAMFTIFYNFALLLGQVLRYQKEADGYLQVLKTQSITRLQQSKMSALGEMASGVALQINQPLNQIVDKINQMEKNFDSGSKEAVPLAEDFQRVKQFVGKIAQIVGALRTYSRNADHDPIQTIQVKTLFEEALVLFGEKLQNHSVEMRITGDPGALLACRPTQLCQVIVNLIMNSVEAVQSLPERWIEIDWKKIDGQLQISFTDSGQGIPSEIRDQLMQPFFTTKNSDKNTGLGLSVCKEFIENHQGSINLDPTAEHTRFLIKMAA